MLVLTRSIKADCGTLIPAGTPIEWQPCDVRPRIYGLCDVWADVGGVTVKASGKAIDTYTLEVSDAAIRAYLAKLA